MNILKIVVHDTDVRRNLVPWDEDEPIENCVNFPCNYEITTKAWVRIIYGIKATGFGKIKLVW